MLVCCGWEVLELEPLEDASDSMEVLESRCLRFLSNSSISERMLLKS